MAADATVGTEQYWDDGLPEDAIDTATGGNEVYWQDGLPEETLSPAGAAVTWIPKVIFL